MKKSCKRVGDIKELEVCSYLMNQGFEVFRNLGSTGLVDIVAIDVENNNIHLFDSKTPLEYQKKNGVKVWNTVRVSPEQKKLGVKVITVFNGKIFTSSERIHIEDDQ